MKAQHKKMNIQDVTSHNHQLFRLKSMIHPNSQIAKMLWDDTLSDEERVRLGSDFPSSLEKHGGPVQFWVQLYGVRHSQALIEIAEKTNLITKQKFQALQRYLDQKFGDQSAGTNYSGNDGEASNNTTPETAIEARIQHFTERYRLVLVRQGGLMHVHLDGREVLSSLSLTDAPGHFLWLLAAFRKRGAGLDSDGLAQVNETFTLRNAKYQLMKLIKPLAPELDVIIGAKRGRGYWLDLETREFCRIEILLDGTVREVRFAD